jgi:hypothetical protein
MKEIFHKGQMYVFIYREVEKQMNLSQLKQLRSFVFQLPLNTYLIQWLLSWHIIYQGNPFRPTVVILL